MSRRRKVALGSRAASSAPLAGGALVSRSPYQRVVGQATSSSRNAHGRNVTAASRRNPSCCASASRTSAATSVSVRSDSGAASCADSIVRQRDARATSSGSSGATDATNDANSGLALSIASATVPPVDRRSDSSSLGAATTAAALTRSAVACSAGEGVGTAGRHAQYREPVDAELVGDRDRVVRDRGLARLVARRRRRTPAGSLPPAAPQTVRRRRARSSRRAGCRGSRGRTPPACPPDRRPPRAGRVDRRGAAARRCRSSHEPRHFW